MIVLPHHCGKEFFNLPKDNLSMRHMMSDVCASTHVYLQLYAARLAQRFDM